MQDFDRLNRIVKRLQERYPRGTRIVLLSMGNDPNPVLTGTRGTVNVVDDIATVHCTFDNGRSLGIAYGEDSFRAPTAEELAEESECEDRGTGRRNAPRHKSIFGYVRRNRRLQIGAFALRRFFVPVGYCEIDPYAKRAYYLSQANPKLLSKGLAGVGGDRVYAGNGLSCTLTSSAGGFAGNTGLYFMDMNTEPKITELARCITARQDSGISNHRGEHSGVLN